ncbi:putative aarF domain-containing protein kinase 2 [Branchiostoma belcheri]|nr:putative aarF domain-containing protein kinase 2 [Branchiostoma belcheri]
MTSLLLLNRTFSRCVPRLSYRTPVCTRGLFVNKWRTPNSPRYHLWSRNGKNKGETANYGLLPVGAICFSYGFTIFPLSPPNILSNVLRRFGRFKDPVSSTEDKITYPPKSKVGTYVKKRRNFVLQFLLTIWRYFRVTLRVLWLLYRFGPLFCIYPLTYTSQRFTSLWWKLFLNAIEAAGPTFIKLGQWASTRRDLFTDEFCDRFSRLHVHVKPHSWFFTKRRLQRAFGKNWRKIFVKFENMRKPIGSGCIAQVYKVYMRPEMIKDEELRDEIMEDLFQVEAPDFTEAWEVTGFGDVLGSKDKELDDLEEEIERSRLARQHVHGVQSGPTDPDSTAESSQFQDQPSPDPQIHDEFEGLIPVAIKVLHPGLYRTVKRDLSIMSGVAWLLEWVPGLKWLSLSEIVNEFGDLIMSQIDLRHEAANLERFKESFADIDAIRFPKPIRPYVRRDILVETFEEGEPITNFMSDDSSECLKAKLAEMGIEALLKMIFVDNFVHGDLHPGNILVMNAESYNPEQCNKMMLVDMCDTVIVNVKPVENPIRLVLLDVGIIAELEEQDRLNFRDVFTAVVLGEGEQVAELILHHARANECKNVAQFKKEMADLVQTARENTVTLGQIQVGELLNKVFSLLIKHKVKLESNFANMVLAIVVLEGLGRTLDPNLDILEAAKPILLGTNGY